jgi:outer membrane protein OmpA-like peptidoglycan-associated protein
MKTRLSAGTVLLVLLLAAVGLAQIAPTPVDSSHQPPSPLAVPDEEMLPGEPVPAKLDTITVQLDTLSKARDSVTIQIDTSSQVGDSDTDGVADSLDHCPNTPHGRSADKTGCLVMTQLNRRLVLHVTYFLGTTKPDPYTLSILDDLIIRLNDSSQTGVTVEGFTDNIGEDSANLAVSQKRADKIKAYLVKKVSPRHGSRR